jgi:anti-sigma regulatory factor (Ser/Thr protein kinase)
LAGAHRRAAARERSELFDERRVWTINGYMCDLGVLWRFESEHADGALAHRHAFLELLERHSGWSLDVYAAKIIFTELVTNVMRHARGPIQILLECDRTQVTLKIADRGPGFTFTPRLPEDILHEGGRGLFLISKVAAAVRVESAGSGTSVIALLPRKGAPK